MSFPPYTAQLLGYCEMDATALWERLQTGERKSLINLKGDYCWILESDQETYIITSPYGAYPYYYTLQKGQLFHIGAAIVKSFFNRCLFSHANFLEPMCTRMH